ncbi:MAG: isocitrate lyase/PEP mutase family protein [Pikeienuella sp.]
MATVEEKRTEFRALHVPGDPLVMPNPWDLGSARLFDAMGAKAMATTSSGHAFTIGLPDMGHVTAEQAFAHAAEIVGCTELPVNADFENGYGAAPEAAAATVRRAAEIGLAGCSIEDTDLPGPSLTEVGAYGFSDAMERAEACIAVAKESGIVLTLRADGFMNGAYDEAEALRRTKAFAGLGADVVYAPLVSMEALAEMSGYGVPVNALITRRDATQPLSAFAEAGAARISIGGSLARVTHQVIMDAAKAMMGQGDFSILKGAASGDAVDELLIR